MNTTLSSFEKARLPLEAVLDDVSGDDWSNPSACSSWDVRGVISHLISTQREFFAERGFGLGAPSGEEANPATLWRAHAQQVESLLRDDAVAETEFEGFFGPTTVGETFQRFYVWDMLVHRWDIATAVGGDAGLTDAELDRIDEGATAFGEALYMEGICEPALESGVDASRMTQVLARLGRRA